MQFIPLDNMIIQLRRQASANNNIKIVGVDGNSHSFQSSSNYSSTYMPFFCNAGNNISSETTSTSYCVPHASSATAIPSDTYTILNEVGSTESSIVQNALGWTMTITVTADSDATVNSLIFTRILNLGDGNNKCVLWAVKLDTPVELNAENNYTASFTFAIEF